MRGGEGEKGCPPASSNPGLPPHLGVWPQGPQSGLEGGGLGPWEGGRAGLQQRIFARTFRRPRAWRRAGPGQPSPPRQGRRAGRTGSGNFPECVPGEGREGERNPEPPRRPLAGPVPGARRGQTATSRALGRGRGRERGRLLSSGGTKGVGEEERAVGLWGSPSVSKTNQAQDPSRPRAHRCPRDTHLGSRSQLGSGGQRPRHAVPRRRRRTSSHVPRIAASLPTPTAPGLGRGVPGLGATDRGRRPFPAARAGRGRFSGAPAGVGRLRVASGLGERARSSRGVYLRILAPFQ